MGKESEIKGLRAALDNNKCLHLRSWRRPRQWSRAAAAVRPCWAPAPDCCRYLLSTDIYWYLLYRYLLSTAPLLQLIHGAASSPIHNKEMSSRISYEGKKTVKSVITQTMNSEPFITYCLSTHQYCSTEETYSTTIKSYSGGFYVASFSSLTAEENSSSISNTCTLALDSRNG